MITTSQKSQPSGLQLAYAGMNDGDQIPTVRSLSDSLVYEIVKGFGLPDRSLFKSFFRILFLKATDHLASLGLNFDQTVAERGIATAARELLDGFCHPVRSYGLENVPTEGPALIVSNHPGTVDSLALFSQMDREDVCIISSRILFVKALPHASRHFIP